MNDLDQKVYSAKKVSRKDMMQNKQDESGSKQLEDDKQEDQDLGEEGEEEMDEEMGEEEMEEEQDEDQDKELEQEDDSNLSEENNVHPDLAKL
jgi:hypothetical protein